MPATYYPAIIDRSASGFGVTFPDFPGCVANGTTVGEACLQAEQALALHVEAMVKDKDAIPAPSDLDAIEDVEGADDVARVMVRVEVPAKVERVLVSIDANLLRAIDAAAPNRSAFLAEAARAALRRQDGISASKHFFLDALAAQAAGQAGSLVFGHVPYTYSETGHVDFVPAGVGAEAVSSEYAAAIGRVCLQVAGQVGAGFLPKKRRAPADMDG